MSYDGLKHVAVKHDGSAKRAHRRRGAFTLVELVISILLIMILSTGALGYQYYSARDVKHAEVQTTATRLAMLLLESWKGQWGDSEYNPEIALGNELTINLSNFGPSAPQDNFGFPFIINGTYEIVVDGIYYYATMSYDDSFFDINPRMINVIIAWNRNYQQASADLAGDAPSVKFSTFIVEY